jgi:hypothetical protein
VLRKTFRPEKEEVLGDWTRLHNEELQGFYSSPNIIRAINTRSMRWHVARVRESRDPCRVVVGKPGVKRPLGRPRGRWECNIKFDLKEMGWEGVYWIHMAEDRTNGGLF